MNEKLLHYIWKTQKFDSKQLITCQGQQLVILKHGYHNHDAGPDFSDARIVIEDIEWAGNLEIHVKSSDWYRHQHQYDQAYQNVILHVVWEHDREIMIDDQLVPVLELRTRVPESLLTRYEQLMYNIGDIPCAPYLEHVPKIIKASAVTDALVERIEQKANVIHKLLKKTAYDWDQVAYQMVARAFGYGTNKDAFSGLAQAAPWKIVRKETANLKGLEPLLFGQSGFLLKPADSYASGLQEEWQYLARKYSLPRVVKPSVWKFLRLRPANFPTYRIAQLAAFLVRQPRLFALVLEGGIDELKSAFKVSASSYWITHDHFGRSIKKSYACVGAGLVDHILINAVAPLRYSWGEYNQLTAFKEQALEVFYAISPENNKITRNMQTFGFTNEHAADSQGLLQLYQHHCIEKRCIECKIGASILNFSP